MITKESKESMDYLESILGKKPTLGDYLLAIRQGEELSQVGFARLLCAGHGAEVEGSSPSWAELKRSIS